MTLTNWNPEMNTKIEITTPSQYLANAEKTESVLDQSKEIDVPILIETLALASQLGKVVNLLKKKMFYGTPVTYKQIEEQLETVKGHVDAVFDELAQSGVEPDTRPVNVHLRFLHSVLGHVTEAAELAEVAHTCLIEDQVTEAQMTNIIEELGDSSWYTACALNWSGTSFEEMWTKNINKLAARFPNQKFTQAAANNRDLDKELKELQS